MKNIFIFSVFAILFFMANTTQAQDYFKERRYEGIDFTKRNAKKYYVTISRKKYELVDKEEELFLGQKISFEKNQRLFYIKRQKKAMTFKETINFMKYVGNEESAKQLQNSLTMYKMGYSSITLGTIGIGLAIFLPSETGIEDGEGRNLVKTKLISLGAGAMLYGVGYLFYRGGNNSAQKAVRYHNKNVRKFSKPVIAKNDFMPSNLGFKSVRTNLLNPTPVPTLSMSWNF